MVRTGADAQTLIDLTGDNSVSTVPVPDYILVIVILIKKDADDGAGELLQERSTKPRVIKPTEQIEVEVAKKARKAMLTMEAPNNPTRGILLQQPLAGEKCEDIIPVHASDPPVQEMVNPRTSVSFILMDEDTTATENTRMRIISTKLRRKSHVGRNSFFFSLRTHYHN